MLDDDLIPAMVLPDRKDLLENVHALLLIAYGNQIRTLVKIDVQHQNCQLRTILRSLSAECVETRVWFSTSSELVTDAKLDATVVAYHGPFVLPKTAAQCQDNTSDQLCP